MEKLRKPNWLNELRVLSIAGIVLIIGFAALDIIRVTVGGGAPEVEIPKNPNFPNEFELGGQAMEQLSTRAAILEPTPAQVAWYLAATLPSAIVLLVVLFILLRILSRARRANPFTRATVRDLRWTAAVLIGGGTLVSLVEGVASMAMSEAIDTGTITGTWKIPVLWLLAGFGALAVSEIVARGCALREELDEVV